MDLLDIMINEYISCIDKYHLILLIIRTWQEQRIERSMCGAQPTALRNSLCLWTCWCLFPPYYQENGAVATQSLPTFTFTFSLSCSFHQGDNKKNVFTPDRAKSVQTIGPIQAESSKAFYLDHLGTSLFIGRRRKDTKLHLESLAPTRMTTPKQLYKEIFQPPIKRSLAMCSSR